MSGGLPYQIRLGDIDLVTTWSPRRSTSWELRIPPDGFSGWRDGAQESTEATADPSGWGKIPGASSWDSLQITISGSLVGTTLAGPGSVEEGLDVLRRNRRPTLTVAEPSRGLVRCCDCRLTQVQETRKSNLRSTVTLSLTADDPLRYSAGSMPLVNGVNVMPNRGDVTAFGRLALTGPHGQISIVHPGGTWTLPQITAGQSRLVDWRSMTVWNGNSRLIGADAGEPPRVPPAGCTWTVSGLGAGAASVSRCEAWS